MKRSSWFTVLPLTLIVQSSLAANLISDGGFETGILHWSSSNATLSVTPLAAETGQYGLLVDSAYDWCPYGAVYTLDNNALQTDTLYEFGARGRLNDGESGDAGLWMGLTINGADPVWLDGDQSSYDARVYPNRWTTLYGVYKTNLNASDTVSLCISGANGKTVNLDNAFARPLTTAEVGYQPPTILNSDDLVHADGNRLVLGPNNDTYILKGVNVYQYDPGENDPSAHDSFSYKNAKADSYQEIAELGFNSVRLMLAYSIFEDNNNPGVFKDEGWAIIDRHIQWAKASGLRLILDMHVPPGGYQSADGFHNFNNRPDLQQRLENLWVAIAQRYRNETAILAYDLINEPWVDNWFTYAQNLIDKIRVVDPNHLIDVEVSFHPQDAGMYPLADSNILYDVHWYEPWSWAGSHTNNTPYTGDLESFKQDLREGEGLSNFYDPATDHFTVPFNIGEYGVVFEKYELAGVNGLQWLQDANDAFDHFGISRQLFAYNETNFGIYRGWNSYPGEHTTTTEPLLLALPAINGSSTPPPGEETDLAVTLSHTPASASVGETVSFNLQISNLGTVTTDAQAELSLLSGMQLQSIENGCVVQAGNLSCIQTGLAPGASQSWSIHVSFDSAGDWQTLARVYSSSLVDNNASNDQAFDVVTVSDPLIVTDLVLENWAADDSELTVNELLGVNLTIDNAGAEAATDVRFVLPLPTGIEWVSSTADCVQSTTELVCDFGDLEAWSHINHHLYLRPTSVGTFTLSGNVQTSTGDANPSNNAASLTIQVNEPPPAGVSTDMRLSVYKITSRNPRVGRALGFKYKLINRGDEVAENVRFTMPMPAGFSWVSGPSECNSNGLELVCSYGDLNPGTSRTRYLYLRPSTAGGVTVTGSVVSDTEDNNTANDAITLDFTVQ
jgi:endoglucanase